MKLLWTVWLTCFTWLSWAQVQLPVDTRYVVALSGLNVRSEAGTGTPVVAKLPYGSQVRSLGLARYDAIGGREGAWEKIQFGKQTGYVFNPYLSLLPAPPLDLMTERNGARCADLEGMGYEMLLRTYLARALDPRRSVIELTASPDGAGEGYHALTMQLYELGVVVFVEQWYESSSTTLRVFGLTPYQALAWVEALMQNCPESQVLDREPVFVKDNQGGLLEIRDGLHDGYLYRVRSLGYLLVEINMKSGV